jgi:predicted aspartyl protease
MLTKTPFRLVGGDQPLIVVAARFNGSEPIDCALDTGASHAVLLPEIGHRLGLEIEGTRQAHGAAGSMRVEMAKAESIALGDAVVHGVSVLMSDDLRRIGEAIGHPLGGCIGFSFLERFRVSVDYAGLTLTLSTPDEAGDTGPARVELPFTLAHPSKPLVLLPVKVDGHEFRFALDTGASTTVVSPELARRCELASTAMPSMTGGGGTVAASSALIQSLQIGGVRISRVRVAVAEFLEMLSRATGVGIDGILGTNVLRRFTLTIDYPGKIVRLA